MITVDNVDFLLVLVSGLGKYIITLLDVTTTSGSAGPGFICLQRTIGAYTIEKDSERVIIMDATLDAAELKQLVKDALSELVAECREDFQELLAETFEEVVMCKAIHDGENTSLVDREDILRLLCSPTKKGE